MRCIQKNELYGALALSTKAKAKIVSVDYEAASELPGVVNWVDHTDMPSPRANIWGASVSAEPFLAVNEVFTTGQPIGMICAGFGGKETRSFQLPGICALAAKRRLAGQFDVCSTEMKIWSPRASVIPSWHAGRLRQS